MNKKGFTLVELLAVIAILAILMLLIMPNVLGMYNGGKKDTFKTQVENIIRIAETQKQSDSMGGKNITYYCSGLGNGCTSDMKLSTSENGMKYYVTFGSGVLASSVAFQDNNYCYVKSGNVTEINEDDFIAGGVLTCTDSACTCAGENGSTLSTGSYVYWSINEGGSDIFYSNSSKPTTTYSNYEDLHLTSPAHFIRTKLGMSGEVLAHEACLYYNHRVSCLSGYFFENDASYTVTKLKNKMESDLGVSATVCTTINTANGRTGAICIIGENGDCISDPDNIVRCQGNYNMSGGCYSYSDGSAMCDN